MTTADYKLITSGPMPDMTTRRTRSFVQMTTTGSSEQEASTQINDASTAYKSAKAIQKGWKLWCVWSKDEPFQNYRKLGTVEKPQGFVVHTTADMRKMAMDLLALADAVEEIESMWDE